MKFEFFLAQRIRPLSKNESTVSGRIIKIAIGAIALGMIMMLIAVAATLGLQDRIKTKTIALSGHMRIAPFENNHSSISTKPIHLSELSETTWDQKSEIEAVYSYVNKGVLLKNDKEFEGGIIKGVTADFPWEKFQTYWIDGTFLNLGDTLSKDLVLSLTMVNKLNLTLGDRVVAYFQSDREGGLPKVRYFTLTGIYETGFPDFDQSFAIADQRQMQRLNQWEETQVGGLEVFLHDQVNRKEVVDEIYELLPSHIDVQAVEQLYADIFDWIALFDFNAYIIILVMLLVGTLNMSSALLVLILERARMVGVLKALGARNFQIQVIFLCNAFYIIGRGLFWGNLFGLLLLSSQWLWGWMKLDPAIYYVDQVPLELPISYWLGLNLFIWMAGIVLLWVPSIIITRIDPIKVLKFR